MKSYEEHQAEEIDKLDKRRYQSERWHFQHHHSIIRDSYEEPGLDRWIEIIKRERKELSLAEQALREADPSNKISIHELTMRVISDRGAVRGSELSLRNLRERAEITLEMAHAYRTLGNVEVKP